MAKVIQPCYRWLCCCIMAKTKQLTSSASFAFNEVMNQAKLLGKVLRNYQRNLEVNTGKELIPIFGFKTESANKLILVFTNRNFQKIQLKWRLNKSEQILPRASDKLNQIKCDEIHMKN